MVLVFRVFRVCFLGLVFCWDLGVSGFGLFRVFVFSGFRLFGV